MKYGMDMSAFRAKSSDSLVPGWVDIGLWVRPDDSVAEVEIPRGTRRCE